MAKKKKQYPKRTRNIIIGSSITFAIFAFIAVALVFAAKFDEESRSYIAKIDGVKIPIGEFKLGLFEQKMSFEQIDLFGDGSMAGTEVWDYMYDESTSMAALAKAQAYSNLLSTKIGALKAKEYGVDSLSEEQEIAVQQNIDVLYTYYTDEILDYIGLDDEGLRTAFTEAHYYDNLFNKITEDYIIDEEELEISYAEYLESNLNGLKTYKLYYIITEDAESLMEAVEKYNDGAEFADLLKEYSMDYYEPEPIESEETSESDTTPEPEETLEPDTTPEPEETPAVENQDGEDEAGEEISDFDYYNLLEILGEDLPDSVKNYVYELEVGGITEVIPMLNADMTSFDNYIVLKLLEVIEPDWEQIEADYRESFTLTAKENYYRPIFEEWINEYNVEINQKAYNSVTIYGTNIN